MHSIFKYPSVFFSGGFIGIGIGIILGNFLILKGALLWISVIISLVLGGFLLALGFTAKSSGKEKKAELDVEDIE